MEESWKKLYTRLERDVKWTDVIGKKVKNREGNSPQKNGDLIDHHVVAALGEASEAPNG